MDIIAADCGIGVIEIIGCADACGHGCNRLFGLYA